MSELRPAPRTEFELQPFDIIHDLALCYDSERSPPYVVRTQNEEWQGESPAEALRAVADELTEWWPALHGGETRSFQYQCERCESTESVEWAIADFEDGELVPKRVAPVTCPSCGMSSDYQLAPE